MKLEDVFHLDDEEIRISQTKKGQQNKLAFADIQYMAKAGDAYQAKRSINCN